MFDSRPADVTMYDVFATSLADYRRVRLTTSPVSYTRAEQLAHCVNRLPTHPFYADARIETASYVNR